MSKFKYVAFISYQRNDEEWAKWLHHQLEHYHLPVDIPKLNKKLRPMFLDEEELAGGNLDETIREALNASRHLIVLCSPNSAKSEWVNKEVQTFIDNDRTNHIIPVIIDGIPYSGNADTECFVPALQKLRRTAKERLGINAKSGREMASVKVVSQLLKVSFSTLWNRYEKEKEQERARLIEEKRRLQRLESRYLTEKGLDAIKASNSCLARRIALRALPEDIHNPEDRPFVGEAADMLVQAYQYNNSIYSEISKTIYSARFGLKDNLFATSGYNIKGVDIWDASLGIPIKHLQCDASLDNLTIASDGTRIIASGFDCIYIFNLEDDSVKHIELEQNEEFTNKPHVEISPCGRYLAYDSHSEIILYDINNAVETRRFTGHSDKVSSIAFCPHGKHMISGSMDRTIKTWDLETGECIHTIEAKSRVRSVAFNSDGTQILAALAAGVIVLWTIHSEEKPKVFRGHTGQVCSAQFSSDDKMIISSSNDHTVRLWDTETGESKIIASHDHTVRHAALSQDCRYVISISTGVMKITDLKGNDFFMQRSKTVETCIEAPNYTFSQDSRYIFYASHTRDSDNIEFYKWDIDADTIKEYTVRSVKPDADDSPIDRMTGSIRNLYAAPDNKHLLINVDKEGLYVFDIESEAVVKRFDNLDLYHNEFHPTACRSEIIIHEFRGDVSILNLETLKITKLFNTYKKFKSANIQTDNIGNLYVFCKSGSKKTHVYDLAARKIINTIESLEHMALATVEFSKDGKLLLAKTSHNIELWDVHTQKCILTLVDKDRICRNARFSPDDRYAIVTLNRKVQIWDIKSAQCIQTVSQPGALAGDACFSPDGTKWAFTTWDKTIHVRNFIPIATLIEETIANYKEIGLSENERKALYLE